MTARRWSSMTVSPMWGCSRPSSRRNFELVTAMNGADALEAVQRAGPDILLLTKAGTGSFRRPRKPSTGPALLRAEVAGLQGRELLVM